MAFSYLSGYDTKVEIDLTNSVINVLQKIQEYNEDIKDLQLTDVRYSSDLSNIHNSLNSNLTTTLNHSKWLSDKIDGVDVKLDTKIDVTEQSLLNVISDLDDKTGADEIDYAFTTVQTLKHLQDYNIRLDSLEHKDVVFDSNLNNISDTIKSNDTKTFNHINYIYDRIEEVSNDRGADELDYAVTTVQTLNNILDHSNKLKSLDHKNIVNQSKFNNIFDNLNSNYQYTKNHVNYLKNEHFTTETDFGLVALQTLNVLQDHILDIKDLKHANTITQSNLNNIFNSLSNNYQYTKNHVNYLNNQDKNIYNILDTKLNISYVYFVDKFNGDDAFDGKSDSNAFKTLDWALRTIPKTGANVTIYLNNVDGDGSNELLNVYQFNNRYEFKNCNITLRSLNPTQRYAVIKQGPSSSLTPHNGYTYPAHFLLYNSYFKTEYCNLITASNSDLAVGADPYLPSASFFECFANTTVWIHSWGGLEYEFTKVKFNDVKLFLDWKGDSTFGFYRCIIDSDYPSVDVTGQKIARLTSSSTLSSSSVTFESEIFSSDTVDNATVWSTLLDINDSAIVDLNF